MALLNALLELAAKMWDRDRSWTYLHTTYKKMLVSQELKKKVAYVRNFEDVSDKFNVDKVVVA
jgi:hypothetical protein